jgi:hypothetical protein
MVPQAYLHGFAREKVLAVHRRGKTEPEYATVRRAAFETDFYGYTIDGELDVSMETWLGDHVDGPSSGPLGRLRDGTWPPSADDRSALALMLAFQLVRTTRVRAVMERFDEIVAPLMWAITVDAPPETMPAEVLTERDPRSFLRTMQREADRHALVIADRAWSLLTSKAPALLTSDNPVALFFPLGDPAGFAGIAPPEAQLLFPVDPCRLLVVEPVGSEPGDCAGTLTAEYVSIANTAQVRAAHRCVFRHPDMPWPADIVLPATTEILPTPTVRISRSTDGTSTFPTRHPTPHDERIAAVLRELDADDIVE